MTTIHCRIGDSDYRLDYDGSRIISGFIYHGTVYMHRLLDFYCELPDDNGPILFSPHDTPQEVKDAVLKAIVEHEHGQ